MRRFVKNWAPGFRRRIVTVPYSKLPVLEPLPRATVIFGDIDSLEGEALEQAQDLYRKLAAERPPRMILNQPGRTLTRHDLLDKLHRTGINEFAVRPLAEAAGTRFPAFLRSARGHRGTITRLLRDEKDLQRAVAQLRRVAPEDVLVVEFRDTSDEESVFRKYSAFRIGQHIIPVHVLFSRYWMQKRPDLVDPSKIEEEHLYLRDNPHREELLRLFQVAGAEYGRIDYGISSRGIQTWEINTNPVIMLEPWQYRRGRLPNARRYAKALVHAFEEIDVEPGLAPLRWRLKRSLVCGWVELPLAIRTRLGLALLRAAQALGAVPELAGRKVRPPSPASQS